MERIEQTVFIRAPLREVFRIAADWRRWEEWFAGASNFAAKTTWRLGNGARYAYTANFLGIPTAVESEVIEFEEYSGWVEMVTKGIAHRSVWSFMESGDGTEFTYALEFQLPFGIGVLLAPLIRRQWRQLIQESILALDHLITTDGRDRGCSTALDERPGDR